MSEVIATPPASTTKASRTGSSPILCVRNVEKVYGGRQNLVYALAGVSFDVARGEFVAIMGPSGSGKTTMLNCISTIDRPSAGRILINGSDITTMSKNKLSAFRRDELGFIFQDSNLLDTLTGMENIALALTIKGARPASITTRINDIARTLNVTESLSQYPAQMSGGQKQRVAAAVPSSPTPRSSWPTSRRVLSIRATRPSCSRRSRCSTSRWTRPSSWSRMMHTRVVFRPHALSLRRQALQRDPPGIAHARGVLRPHRGGRDLPRRGGVPCCLSSPPVTYDGRFVTTPSTSSPCSLPSRCSNAFNSTVTAGHA